MDWNLKKTPSSSWHIPEFEQETSLGGEQITGEFSVDLKLGHVANAGSSRSRDNLVAPPSVPKKALMPPVGPSKRARAVNSGVHLAYCLVDGCNADLSGCREYHRRHKVCEMHSKAPEVTIGGLRQRFCQQCSRFHSLEEFDEGKRSCRKRLEGHNRRRRKPQPDPFLRSSTFLSDYHGTRLFPFSSAESYPATALSSPLWAGDVKTEQDSKLYNQHLHGPVHSQYIGPSSSSYKEGKPSSFMHGSTLVLSNQASSEASSGQLFYSSPESSGSGRGRELLSPDLSTQCLNSNCALSLLSSPPICSREISPSHMAPPNSIPPPHPFGLTLHSNSLDTINLAPVPNSDEGMFGVGHGSSSKNEEASQTLPFCWD